MAFNGKIEEAVDLYVSTIRNSRILESTRMEGVGPELKDTLVYCTFELDGVEYAAMEGGPSFRFAEGTSLMATVNTQEERDRTGGKPTSGVGEGGGCGWPRSRAAVAVRGIAAARAAGRSTRCRRWGGAAAGVARGSSNVA